MKKNNAIRNISLAINVVTIITIAILMCLNQATENKLKTELDSKKSVAYTAGYVAAIADSTPVKIGVGNSGALITFANGEGYFLDAKSIDNEILKSYENCISEEDKQDT